MSGTVTDTGDMVASSLLSWSLHSTGGGGRQRKKRIQILDDGQCYKERKKTMMGDDTENYSWRVLTTRGVKKTEEVSLELKN